MQKLDKIAWGCDFLRQTDPTVWTAMCMNFLLLPCTPIAVISRNKLAATRFVCFENLRIISGCTRAVAMR